MQPRVTPNASSYVAYVQGRAAYVYHTSAVVTALLLDDRSPHDDIVLGPFSGTSTDTSPTSGGVNMQNLPLAFYETGIKVRCLVLDGVEVPTVSLTRQENCVYRTRVLLRPAWHL